MVSHLKKSRQITRALKRASDKALRSEMKSEARTFLQLSILLNNILSENQLETLAKKFGVIERKRKLKAITLVGILIVGCIHDGSDACIRSLNRMCLQLRTDSFDSICIKPQALQKKINQPETAKFIKEIMSRILAYKVEKNLKKLLDKSKNKVSSLYRILLQDSTVISLPDSLKRIFRGCGGSANEAGLKCDYIIDQSNHLVLRVKFVSGRIPDAAMSADIIDYLRKGDLVIRDLGYFNLSQLSRISHKKAKFISRLSKSTNIYLNKKDQEPIDLIQHMKTLKIEKKGIDIDVYVGKKERLKVRLIGVKVPLEVVEARKKKYKRNNKKVDPSEEMCEWNGYTFMICNVPRDELSITMILKLYGIRWQIELFFKNMKSNLCIDKITGKNKNRILCIIYIKTVLTCVVTYLYAYAHILVEDREISLAQFTKWLKENGRLRLAIVSRDFSSLLDELKRDVDLLCKQKRRKSTLNDIEECYNNEKKHKKAA